MGLAILRNTASRKIIRVSKFFLHFFGIGLTSYKRLVLLQESEAKLAQHRLNLEFVLALSLNLNDLTISMLDRSKAQLRQDIFVLSETKYKRGGFFVEFGATNGIDLSNTYLLEKDFSWRGILAEPGKVWNMQLVENRPNATIETQCLWKDSNSKLIFNETDVPELSTIDIFSDKDLHKIARLKGKNYEVETISLNDLLIKHQAPKYIDYLSIDTEGSEYEILNAFNFSEFSIGIITVEHNYSPQREEIFALLSRNGYTRKYENVSHFDDWYTKI